MSTEKILFNLGRIGLGAVFVYFGVTSIIDPKMFSSLIPNFVTGFMSATTAITIHAIIEIICGTFIIFGFRHKIPAIILCFSMLPIIFVVSGLIRVHDIGILSSLLVLISIEIGREKSAKTLDTKTPVAM